MNGYFYMVTFLALGIISILAVISWSDIKQRRISNNSVLALLALLLLFCYLHYGEIFILNGLATLAIGFVLFSLNVIGAGDVKLLAVLMLAVPGPGIVPLLFFISFFGFLLIVIGWIFFRQNIKTQGLPYGVAISCGFLFTMWSLN